MAAKSTSAKEPYVHVKAWASHMGTIDEHEVLLQVCSSRFTIITMVEQTLCKSISERGRWNWLVRAIALLEELIIQVLFGEKHEENYSSY